MKRVVIAAILAVATAHHRRSSAGMRTVRWPHLHCGVSQPEDLVVVPNTRWMLASGMAPGSGLHLVDTQAKTVKNLYAVGTAATRADRTKYATCTWPLDPKQALLHGLSLRSAASGRYPCTATNHGGRESVEVFELNARLGPWAPGLGGGGANRDVGSGASWRLARCRSTASPPSATARWSQPC